MNPKEILRVKHVAGHILIFDIKMKTMNVKKKKEYFNKRFQLNLCRVHGS